MRIGHKDMHGKAVGNPVREDGILRIHAIPQGGCRCVQAYSAKPSNPLKYICGVAQIYCREFGSLGILCKHTHTHTLATRVKVQNIF